MDRLKKQYVDGILDLTTFESHAAELLELGIAERPAVLPIVYGGQIRPVVQAPKSRD